MVHDSIIDCIGTTPLVRLQRLTDRPDVSIFAKLEMLNPGGSVKDRVAKYVILDGLKRGTLSERSHLIESSSGNLGIAIAMVAKHFGMRFTCVVDPATSRANLAILHALDVKVDVVNQRDDTDNYLKTRLRRVQQLLETTPNGVWLNQYGNLANVRAHYRFTAGEIIADLDTSPDCMIAAVSTTGTIMGVAQRLKQHYPRMRVVAVDAVGSVIFGFPGRRRHLPGIGSSVVPSILDRELIDDVIHVTDEDAAWGARELAHREAIIAGGSAGAVVAALVKRVVPDAPAGYRIVTLLADRGERYIDGIYARRGPGQAAPAIGAGTAKMTISRSSGATPRSPARHGG